MSTSGTVVFLDKKLENMKKLDEKNMENYMSVYIHSDMYPSGALPRIMSFLEIEASKRRCYDYSYISAWFVAFIANDLTTYGDMYRDDDAIATGYRYIREIRTKCTKAKRNIKSFEEERAKNGDTSHVFYYQMRHLLNFDTNKFIKESKDFTGIGLQLGLNDWCDYTYIIVPESKTAYDKDAIFGIYVYDFEFELIDVYNSEDIDVIKHLEEGM